MEKSLELANPDLLLASFLNTGWTPEALAQAQQSGIFDQALNVIEGRLKIVPAGPLTEYLVHVDPLTPLPIPAWASPCDPFPGTGSEIFDLGKLEKWVHPNQKHGTPMDGKEALTFLRENDLLPRCLGIREWDAIARAGIHVFRWFLRGIVIYFWRNLVCDGNGMLRVPCLFDAGDYVGRGWRRLDARNLGENMPALMYPEKKGAAV